MASKARNGSVISVSQASDPDLEEAELTDQEASDWSGLPGYWDASSKNSGRVLRKPTKLAEKYNGYVYIIYIYI